jgi:hypothetical protein
MMLLFTKRLIKELEEARLNQNPSATAEGDNGCCI